MPNQVTHPWTQEEIEFLQTSIGKLTYKEMSAQINRTPASIQSKIRYLPFQQKIKKHPVDSDFFKTWSRPMAYVLGFTAADGNICHSGRAHALHIACDDKDIIEKISAILAYKGPIYRKERFNGKCSYSLRICDPIIFYDLQKLNITERKSLTLVPPKVPSDLLGDFIRGYFDGDGTVALRKSQYPKRLVVHFYTASYQMAIFLHQTMAQILGSLYKAKIRRHLTHQKTPYYVVMMGHQAAAILFKYMYKDTDLYLERKYERFLEGLSYAA